MAYCIAGKFGGELNLAVWRSTSTTAKLKSAKISYSYIYVRRSHTEPPHQNPPILLQWPFGTQPPNLIPTNISGYTVFESSCKQVDQSKYNGQKDIILGYDAGGIQILSGTSADV